MSGAPKGWDPNRDAPQGFMSADEFGDIYRRFLDGDAADLISLLGADVVYYLPGAHLGGGTVRGSDALIERLVRATNYCQSVTVDVIDIIELGRFVVSYERFRAARAGQAVDLMMCVVWHRAEDASIAEVWTHIDDQAACDAFWKHFSA